MFKTMHRVYYKSEGKEDTLNQLYREVRKKRGRVKVLASVIVGLGSDEKGSEIQARLVLVRDRNRSKSWLALLSTNLDLRRRGCWPLWETLGHRVLFQGDQIPLAFGERIPIPQLRCIGGSYPHHACDELTGRGGSKNDWTAL